MTSVQPLIFNDRNQSDTNNAECTESRVCHVFSNWLFSVNTIRIIQKQLHVELRGLGLSKKYNLEKINK